MSASAPLCVPVELRVPRSGRGARGEQRWFRLSGAVSEEGLAFPRPLPDEIAGDDGRPVRIAFFLPGDEQPLVLDARVVEVRGEVHGDDDRPRKTALRFLPGVSDGIAAERERIRRYVEARLAE